VASQGAAGDLGKYSLTIESAPEVFVDDSWWTQVHIIPDYLVDPPWEINVPFENLEPAIVLDIDFVEPAEPAVKLAEEAAVEVTNTAVFAELGAYAVTPPVAEDVAPSRNDYTSLKTSSVSRAATSRTLAAWM
jgi:hypothetical protein